jgi:flagella basal body P-ring formation protein FlgA
MMQLIIKNENIKKNSIIQEDIIKIEKENVSSLNDEVSLNKKKVLGGYARRII